MADYTRSEVKDKFDRSVKAMSCYGLKSVYKFRYGQISWNWGLRMWLGMLAVAHGVLCSTGVHLLHALLGLCR